MKIRGSHEKLKKGNGKITMYVNVRTTGEINQKITKDEKKMRKRAESGQSPTQELPVTSWFNCCIYDGSVIQ